jgi:hypothetical protein
MTVPTLRTNPRAVEAYRLPTVRSEAWSPNISEELRGHANAPSGGVPYGAYIRERPDYCQHLIVAKSSFQDRPSGRA